MGVLDLISGPFSEAQAGERRRSVRVAVSLCGALALDGEEIEVSVHDLSSGGAQVEAPVLVGERFVLRVDGWPPTPMVVRWAQDGRAGLAFVG